MMASSNQPDHESRLGTVYSWTTVHAGPPGIATPYLLAWIDTEKGRIFARLRDGAAGIGDHGRAAFVENEGWWFTCER